MRELKKNEVLKPAGAAPEAAHDRGALIGFLSVAQRDVEAFERSMGYGLRYTQSPPERIGGSEGAVADLAFMVIRNNALMPERTYCLYAMYNGGALAGWIGVYRGDDVEPIRELKRLEDFAGRGRETLHQWLAELVKASCNKI